MGTSSSTLRKEQVKNQEESSRLERNKIYSRKSNITEKVIRYVFCNIPTYMKSVIESLEISQAKNRNFDCLEVFDELIYIRNNCGIQRRLKEDIRGIFSRASNLHNLIDFLYTQEMHLESKETVIKFIARCIVKNMAKNICFNENLELEEYNQISIRPGASGGYIQDTNIISETPINLDGFKSEMFSTERRADFDGYVFYVKYASDNRKLNFESGFQYAHTWNVCRIKLTEMNMEEVARKALGVLEERKKVPKDMMLSQTAPKAVPAISAVTEHQDDDTLEAYSQAAVVEAVAVTDNDESKDGRETFRPSV